MTRAIVSKAIPRIFRLVDGTSADFRRDDPPERSECGPCELQLILEGTLRHLDKPEVVKVDDQVAPVLSSTSASPFKMTETT